MIIAPITLLKRRKRQKRKEKKRLIFVASISKSYVQHSFQNKKAAMLNEILPSQVSYLIENQGPNDCNNNHAYRTKSSHKYRSSVFHHNSLYIESNP